MVKQVQRILCLLRDGIGRGAGPFRPAAPAIIGPDQAEVWQMGGEKVEIGPRAGQPGKAEDRQPLALIPVGKAGAVRGGEMLKVHARSSGSRERSGRIWCGAAGRRSCGRPTRLTQVVVNPKAEAPAASQPFEETNIT